MASQKGEWKKTRSTGILLPKETKTIDKHVRRQINRTREKGVTLPSHVLWKTNWPSKETGLEISYKTGYGKGIKMEADWRNAKERHDAVGAGTCRERRGGLGIGEGTGRGIALLISLSRSQPACSRARC